MVEVYKSGKMDLDMMDFGVKEWLMEEEDWYMLTEMFIQENGRMIRLTDLEFNKIIMAVDMKEIGLMISNTEMEQKPGLMVQHMSANINSE